MRPEGVRGDFYLEVAKGNIPWTSGISKIGENPSVGTGGFETVWDGTGEYVPPTQSRIHTVASTSDSDKGGLLSSGVTSGGGLNSLVDETATFVSDGVSAGDEVYDDTRFRLAEVNAVVSETVLELQATREVDFGLVVLEAWVSGISYRVVTNLSVGASVFYVRGLGANFLEQREFIVINGVSGVDTSNSWVRQFAARVYGPGASTSAVGTITSTAQVDGTVSCQIIGSNNQTLMAVSTVPFNQNGFLLSWWASISKKQSAVCNLRLRTGDLNRRMYVIQSRSIDNTGSSSFPHRFFVPQAMAPGVDMLVETDSDTVATGVSAGFDYLLVDR